MSKRILLVVIFLLGLAVGQTEKHLSLYGCTRQNWEQGNIHVKQEVCLVYEPSADKHFVVATISSSNGAGTSIVEEK